MLLLGPFLGESTVFVHSLFVPVEPLVFGQHIGDARGHLLELVYRRVFLEAQEDGRFFSLHSH